MALFKKPAVPPSPPAVVPTGPATPPRIPIDRTSGEPAVQWLRDQLDAGRWEPVAEYLDQILDPVACEFFVFGVNDAGEIATYDRWVEARPTSSSAWLLRGQRKIQRAWELRGSGRAEAVGESAWPTFFAALDDAEADLLRAVELDPNDPVPAGALVWAGIGRQIPAPELCARFEAGHKLHPGMPWAHQALIQGLLPKWVGSWDEAFGFARLTSAAAPPGSPLHAMTPLVHIEAWLDDPKDAYWTPEVMDEIRAHAANGPFHDAWVDTPVTVYALNVFACAAHLAKDYETSNVLIVRIGTRLNRSPWGYLRGGAAAGYERARTAAGLSW